MCIITTSMTKIEKTKLDKVLLVKPDVAEDFRGMYVEIYNRKFYTSNGIEIDFVCDDISTSSHGVLRGVHTDSKAYKLISCVYGRIYFMVLNYDKDSPQFGQWESFILTDANHYQVLVPPKFGNGHLILSDRAIFSYKQSEYYDPSRQDTIRFDDPRFKMWWPIKNPILSQRDDAGKYIEQ